MNEFEKRDPGTYTGHDPELAPEKVPGGVPPPAGRVDGWSSGLERSSELEPEEETAVEDAGQDR